MATITKRLRPGRRLLWLMLSGALGLLCMLSLLGPPEMDWDPTSSFTNSWLEYTDADGNPEDVCNCSAILQGDKEALQQAKLLTITKDFQKSVQIPDEYYVNATKDCRKFKLSRKYLSFPLSQEEEDFPLAYSIIVHHKVQNFERLLRAIYAPQNIYCVHVDKKTKTSVFAAIMAITSCFPNVFMASRPVSVVYAAWPRVQADLNCMADLYNISTTWKYFINLCGQDFPLKTNLEIVRSLRSLKGGNSMESEQMADGKKWRVQSVYQIVDGQIQGTGQAKGSPPFNLPILSGNAYIVVNRGYVRSVLEDSRVLALIEWAKDTYSPDEFLWATIQRMPGVPGSTWPNSKYDMTDINAIARLVKWAWHEGSQGVLEAVYPVCHGNHVRSICVYGAGDLQWMIEQHHLFANKFDIDTDSIAVYCLEKYLRQKALAQIH
ncbi:beta-1,3-galactosyl-O-glycosyl-glycoprotein beta-1,6-N-acetylglucosaminyltransferase-like [Centroberyx affinis]|uniref:beta-1,3-galactosyl-O-glycosyl-glycoprotein beta-1,6-N-acetylglucosaminyltransferase-like n=1 Tax=Centroberyx affinis TaxID=166261 RepID=UPI003A5C30DE